MGKVWRQDVPISQLAPDIVERVVKGRLRHPILGLYARQNSGIATVILPAVTSEGPAFVSGSIVAGFIWYMPISPY